MKIATIEAFPIWVGRRNQLLVKITTDDGLYGWGESGLATRERAVMGAIDHYSELLIGRDALDIGGIWQLLYRSQYFEGGRVLSAAISAIDIALHDIKGKALGVPVWQLLGGKQRNMVPSFATTGTPDDDEQIEQLAALAEDGFSCVRIAISQRSSIARDPGEAMEIFEPRLSIARNVPMLIKARERLGHAVTFGIDYHHELSVAEAASFCQKLPPGTLDFLEEPIRDETPEAYASLRRMTEIPFAIGEEFCSKWQALPYLEQDLSQFMRLDVCLIGGFTEAMKVAALSEAHYVDLMPHNPLGPICVAASVHLGAAVPNFSWLEYNFNKFRPEPELDAELFTQRLALEGANFSVPTGPGLGIEVDEKILRRETFRFAEMPKLRRRDGSFTNW
jgi:galactonate dehydratase